MIPDRSHVLTEQSNPASAHLDQMPLADAVALMNAQDALVVAAVGREKNAIATAAAWAAHAFQNGGRLIYFGAGTSGRLGVLDASECPPTFCSDPAMVVGIIAGGPPALTRSLEKVEDDAVAGADEVRRLNLGPHDVAFGIAAGGTTPFVHGALREAKSRGSRTIFLICTSPDHVPGLDTFTDLCIAIPTGPEILTGSTRLKAGTATKLVLNMVTTLAMVQFGKTFGNLMVDIDALKNNKLIDRSLRIISTLTNLPRDHAQRLLDAAGGQVKRAIVMHHKAVSPAQADQLLHAAHGKLRAILQP